MTEQVSPEDLSTQAESELICETLLGWERLGGAAWSVVWNDKSALGHQWSRTPTFTTWADAGLILDALSETANHAEIEYQGNGRWGCAVHSVVRFGDTGPLAIRAAALAYIRSLP